MIGNEYIKHDDAFTLIELIVVMAIIAILVLLAAPRFLGYTKDANVTAMQQDVKILTDAAELYHVDYNNWPIKNEVITDHGIGGVDELYPIDESKLEGSIKNIKGNYGDYGLVVGGKYDGQVLHLNGVRDKEGGINHGSKLNENKAVIFKGKHYENSSDVPADPTNYYTYKDIEGGLEITGFNYNKINNEEIPKEISLPSKHNGKPVISVGSEAFLSKGLVNVIAKEPLTMIGYRSFEENNLKNIVLPNTLLRIDSRALAHNNLVDLTIPKSVNYIGGRSFNNNNLPRSQAFIYARNNDGSINYGEIISYGNNQHKNITIPKNVRRITGSAFFDSNVHSLELNSTLEHIGGAAFRSNYIRHLVIPKTVKEIDLAGFAENPLISVHIQTKDLTMGDFVFSRNYSWDSYTGSETITDTKKEGPWNGVWLQNDGKWVHDNSDIE